MPFVCLNRDVSRRMFAVLAHGFSINRDVYHRNGKSPEAVAFNGVPEEYCTSRGAERVDSSTGHAYNCVNNY